MNEKKDNFNSSFFALIFRQKHIMRWGLMRNTQNENLSSHTCECAFIAHALAVIGNEIFGKNYDEDRAATLALYHDVAEVFTGDMPTPIKYANEEISAQFKALEIESSKNLMSKLPPELKNSFSHLFSTKPADAPLVSLVKAADKLCAYIKCIEEEKLGNREFSSARLSIKKSLEKMQCVELDYFMQHFLPAFTMTLDEQQNL